MNFFEKSFDKLFIKQWNVGIAKKSFQSVLEIDTYKLDIKWLPINKQTTLFADPFVCTHNNNYYIFFENYCYYKDYGFISLVILNQQFDIIHQSDLLDTQSHLSYPFIYHDNEKIFIMPESSKSKSGNQYYYEFDFSNNLLLEKKVLIKGGTLLDGTILFFDEKYWLFATKRGADSESKLFLYHSKKWNADYIPHLSNPIKLNQKGSRPAGAFINENGVIYRPTQNCENYYGKSVIINKINVLNDSQFEEIPVKEIFAPQNCRNNFGIHTINISNDVIVIDGLRRIFNPFEQIKIFITRKLFRK